jgi:hypothetical protein
MKKLCYFLSIAAHVLAWILVAHARFPITVRPEPPRVTTVRIAEPPPPYIVGNHSPPGTPGDGAPAAADGGAGTTADPGMMQGASSGPMRSGRTLPLPGIGRFNLNGRASAGTFRLAPVGKSPDPWAVPVGPPPSPRLLHYRAGDFRPATGGDNASGGVFLLPFDVREKPVAEWANMVLARIERNWIIPASGRLAFSGRVQVTLTIERQGQRRSLVIDDSDVPETLTLAALHAVQASLPFPPLPENVAGTTLAFTFVFSYNG